MTVMHLITFYRISRRAFNSLHQTMQRGSAMLVQSTTLQHFRIQVAHCRYLIQTTASLGLRKLFKDPMSFSITDIFRWGERAMNEIGIRTTRDFNSGSIMGSQYCATTINPANEFRDTSESSFLTAAAT